jgi:hypothetical protein
MLLATWAAGAAGVVLLPVLRLLATCTAGEGVELLPPVPPLLLPLAPLLLLLLAMLFATCTAGGGVLPLPLPLLLPPPEVGLGPLARPVDMLLASCTAGGGMSASEEFLLLLPLLGLLPSALSPEPTAEAVYSMQA